MPRSGREDLRPALAAAYLQRVRETGDPSFYARAEGVLRHAAHAGRRSRPRASSRSPGMTSRGALTLGRRAGDVGAPIRVDALVELGRYDEAERELQAMIDRKPNLAAYARVSYLRELHGDLDGRGGGDAPRRRRRRPRGGEQRLRARAARRAGAPPRPARPRRGARSARRSRWCPDFAAAEAGLARLERQRRGIERLRRARRAAPARPSTSSRSARPSSPPGARPRRRETLALVAAEQQLQRAAGVDIDVELAVFEADHGSPEQAVALARRGWAAAPSVRAADALGWALTRSGEPRGGPALGAPRAAARLARPALARPRRPLGARRRARRGGPAAAADRARRTASTATRGRRSGSVARCGDPERRSWRYRRP